jgi:hypothetical protein
LVGNAFSIPVMDIILRRLQGMFASKRYEGYTYAFEWKESGPAINDDDSRVSDDDEAQLFPAPSAVASMPSHPQPAEDAQHEEEDQKPSAISRVPRKEVRPKREDEDQKPPAHDDNVDDEKESPTTKVPMKSQKNPPALSGRQISDAHRIPYQEDEDCSLPGKPIIAKECESENEIPRPINTPPSCQVRDLSEELVDI